MLFKGEINCERCIHKNVCSTKYQQDILDAKQAIEKLGETISDIVEVSVKCKEFKFAVRTSLEK